jgi:serine/threonine protein kinase
LFIFLFFFKNFVTYNLADFGFVKNISDTPQSVTLNAGTSYYVAPEIIEGKRFVKVDEYLNPKV